MNKKQWQERINRRCEILRKLGFDVHNEDKFVMVPAGCDVVGVDFSDIDEIMFTQYAFKKVLEYGERKGRNEIRQKINELLVVES